ncbi:ABC transporter ATP-binding protein [Bifidobacterium sp.]|jgi:multiple sugar transport system ATP-binding protein|uniref:ABC transporter ATP-binding protein n=1 Tax=Bifidobacterium sp. TaxID=41200 RepID=UPI0025C72155|nr:ABC transporter ATP-binding protein [Bifidobacterium sp.]MCH4208647.1 ABC transporter ATP-binding protein [Bifidobacterium sp.]MCI1224381.1 ABC transporter ATP-binding protein [Bifidobacterium sp.]
MTITISNLKKTYDNGHQALKDISIDIADGDLVCLLGPSGCGKSTTLNLIAGLLDPTGGDISIDGESVIHRHPKDRNIGMVFQNYALYPHMTVLENVTFPLRVGAHRKSRAEAEAIAKQYMAVTNIEDLADKKPNDISGGQQQRVAITRAMVQKPKMLLLDEPLSNLDARLRLRIRAEIRRLVKEMHITTIFVTHDQEEALSISDRIVLMNEGVVQQYDVPQQLYLDPANLFVATFMGNPIINIIDMAYNPDSKMLTSPAFDIPLAALDASRFRNPAAGGRLNRESYQVGIRPEHFLVDASEPGIDAAQGSLVGGGAALGGARRAVFEARIESVEMIGRYSVLHFDVDGVHARSIVDARAAIRAGQLVPFNIDYPNIYLFQHDGTRVY